jgi:DNA modification methylase
MIKPYYEADGISLFHGDCRDILPHLPKVDLVLTSPPYNMRTRVRNGKYTTREWSEHFSKKYSDFEDAFPIEDYYAHHRAVIMYLLSMSRICFINIGIVTGSKEAWFRIIGDFCSTIKDIIIWDKGEGQPAMHSAVINRSYELILAMEHSASAGRAFKKVYFKRGEMPDIWRLGRGGEGETPGHAAVFPTKLATKIITGWSKQNEIILDPYVGTGTTLVAAKQLGRRAIGIEIEEKYCQIAVERLKQRELGIMDEANSAGESK